MNLKKFRLTLISCILVIPLLFSGTAYAQDEELPDPGITPDSPFYFLDNWGKRIGLVFAFGPEAKARKALEYAEERLAEVQAMALKNRIREMERAADSYNGYLAMIRERVEETRQRGVSENISEKVALATSKHLTVLDRVKDTVPEQAREAIVKAREVSINGQQNALRSLTRKRLERAVEINLATIEDRLSRARVKAEEGNIEEVEEALDDADKLFKFGEEISEIARGLGKDTTTVEQLVAKATSVHLEVLAEVHEKMPEQARVATENTIANSLRNRERVVEALKNKGSLGEIPEEAPVLERIRQESLERIREQVQERVQEEVQERIQERISDLKPEVPKPVVSENETEEKENPVLKRSQSQRS
ncbi:DUF5667 domain-containing protein [Chloroflexota bacterium]